MRESVLSALRGSRPPGSRSGMPRFDTYYTDSCTYSAGVTPRPPLSQICPVSPLANQPKTQNTKDPRLVDAVLGLPPVEVDLRVPRALGVPLVEPEQRLHRLADEGRKLHAVSNRFPKRHFSSTPRKPPLRNVSRKRSTGTKRTLKSFNDGTAYVRTFSHSIRYPPYLVCLPMAPVLLPL